MSQEQQADLMSWWNEQSFAGKELYSLAEDGSLMLNAGNNVKERTVATVAEENRDVVVKALQEKFAEIAAKVKNLEIEWLETEDKMKLADKVEAMREHLQQVCALGDMQQLSALVREWEHTLFRITEENYAVKLKMAETAESLADSDQWKEATQGFKDIADKWKMAGHTDRNRNDKLWNRIEAAKKKYNDRKKAQQDEDGKDMLHNLDLKIDLVEQAESIAASEQWKKTTETFLRLTDEWKTIGHTHNKKNEELWQRFITAKSSFFDRKRDHFNKIKHEQEANYTLKTAMVEKAEALRESTAWGDTSKTYAALMDEWKKTGRVAQEKGDELWKRFTAAQEEFFTAKRRHTEDIRQEHEANYKQKKDLLDRAEQLKNSTQWGETSAEMNELLEEWKKTGGLPRAQTEKLWEDFLAARKHFFARKDANREQKKQYAEDLKAARIEQAKGLVEKHRADLKEEQEKITDFTAAIENITPGKKAAELRSHLEKLIAESHRQIKYLQEKLALAGEEVNSDKPEKAVAGDTVNE